MRYRRIMSIDYPTQDAPEFAHAKSENADDKSESEHGKRLSFLRWWTSPRATAFVALAVAVIAVAAAIAAWLVPVPKHFSGDQSARAKAKVCNSYAAVRNAVAQGTPNPRPDDPVAHTAVAANVRLAMIGGSSFLRETLDAEPATPADLTDAVKSYAATLDELGFAYLLMTKESVKAPLLKTLNSDLVQINQICAPKKK
jgi:hypothetical protein